MMKRRRGDKKKSIEKNKSSAEKPKLNKASSSSLTLERIILSKQNLVNEQRQTNPLYRDIIFEIPDFFTPEECLKCINFGESHGFDIAIQAAGRGYAHRNNGRILIKSPVVADRLWKRLQSYVPQTLNGRKPIGCNEDIRIYRYTQGQSFGKHVDDSVEDGQGNISEYTVLIYLNGHGEYFLRGGETIFYKNKSKIAVSYTPQRGNALLHGHGERCLTHEGSEVVKGIKYLLRTDIMYEL